MTAKKRVSKTRSKVTALPVPEQEQPTYLTLNQQGQAEALLKRLAALENDHFQYVTLIEEETALENGQVLPQLQQELASTEKRITFIRNKMEALGVVFGPISETEQDPENTESTEETPDE